MEKKIRCAIYDRVSHELQVERGYSLEAQMVRLKIYRQSCDILFFYNIIKK